ncbi:MAG: BrnT family toxin [Bifidobacteriaceae bacterium]|jgi:uncharacterized DUF497 family protein|nr:BrnT family toxin [Bifidobacteriaceae bacterium]
MKGLRFEWDERKAQLNKSKHGVTFDEACSAFADPWALIFEDSRHSLDEERFIIIGASEHLRVLAVSYCEKTARDTIRIISARKANDREARLYNRR